MLETPLRSDNAVVSLLVAVLVIWVVGSLPVALAVGALLAGSDRRLQPAPAAGRVHSLV